MRTLFRTVLSRWPTDEETKTLEAAFHAERAAFARDPDSADRLLAVGRIALRGRARSPCRRGADQATRGARLRRSSDLESGRNGDAPMTERRLRQLRPAVRRATRVPAPLGNGVRRPGARDAARRIAGEIGADSRLGRARRPGGAPSFRSARRRVIFLYQSGAPSQVDLFDAKPQLKRRHGEELPASVRGGQRLTTMTAEQASKPIVASPWRFERHGASGAELSELLPFTATVADELCVVRSLHTEAINHDPAITFMQTGSQLPGRPGMGSVGELCGSARRTPICRRLPS